jgi:hypothetical protein
VRDLLNKKKFLAFKQRCRSAGLTEIHVDRRENGRDVRFLYNAKELRSKRVLTGEWVIQRGADSASREAVFLEMARGIFSVQTYEKGKKTTSRGKGADRSGGAEDAKVQCDEEAQTR